MSKKDYLADFYHYLEHYVSINASKLDTDYKLLKSTYNSVLSYKVNAIKINEKYGGLNADFQQNCLLLENLTRASSALTLLLLQTLSSTEIISRFASTDFQEKHLTRICESEITVGLVASHLHQKNNLVFGEDKGDYFILNGTVKFYSGYKFFDHILLGFTNNNSEYFALVAADQLIKQELITYLDLVTCSSTNTISFSIKNFIVDKKLICYQQIRGTFGNLKMKSFSSFFLVSGIIMRLFTLLDQNQFILSNQNINSNYLNFKNKLILLKNEIFSSYKEINPGNMRVKLNFFSNYLFLFVEQVFMESCLIKHHPLNTIKNELFLFSVISIYHDLVDLTIVHLQDLYS